MDLTTPTTKGHPVADNITANCVACSGEGYLEAGDTTNPYSGLAEAFVRECPCVDMQDDLGWRQAMGTAILWGALPELDSFFSRTGDFDKALDLWDEYETKALQGA